VTYRSVELSEEERMLFRKLLTAELQEINEACDSGLYTEEYRETRTSQLAELRQRLQ
jgi:hypothetical protein